MSKTQYSSSKNSQSGKLWSSVINNHTEVPIGSYNPKVLNDYAFLCAETSTKRQARSLPGPELTGLAARPARLPTAHRPLGPSRLPGARTPQRPYPGSFAAAREETERCPSTTRKVLFSPGPGAGLKLFSNWLFHLESSFHVQNPSEYKLLLN